MTVSKSDIAKICAIITSSYPTWEATRERVEVFYDLLKDLEPELLKSATQRWAMTQKWPPTIADLRSLCAEEMGALSPAPEEAWAEVMHIARIYGSTMQIPPWSHPAVEQAVNSIGYREICMSDRVDVLRAHFTKAYEGYRSRLNHQILTSPALASEDRAIALGSVLKQLDASPT